MKEGESNEEERVSERMRINKETCDGQLSFSSQCLFCFHELKTTENTKTKKNKLKHELSIQIYITIKQLIRQRILSVGRNAWQASVTIDHVYDILKEIKD